MKKNTKGAIALGAAALLLAGGAGTYAAWSDSADLGGGTVTTGHLKVTQKEGTSAGWTWVGGTKDGQELSESDTIAPGDTIAYSGTYVLGIKGTNLEAALDVTTPTGDEIPAELTWTPTSSAELTGLNEVEDDEREITAGGQLEFNDDAVDTMDKSISIGDFQVVLKQTAPAVAP